MGGDAVTVRSGEYLGVFLVARSQRIVVYAFVEFATAGHYVGVVVAHFLERLIDGLAVARPISLVALVHIYYVPNLIIAYHSEV